ncbi:MAG: spermidine synthase, partial [Planctomycetaceae bacterium]
PFRIVLFARRSANGGNYALALGMLGGTTVLTACHLFLATFGTALPAVTALALALAVGFESAWRPAKRRLTRAALQRQHGTLCILLAAWGVVLPALMQQAIASAGAISLDVMASPGRALLFQWLVALFVVSPGVYLATRQLLNTGELPAVGSDNGDRDSNPTPSAAAASSPSATLYGASIGYRILHAPGRLVAAWREWIGPSRPLPAAESYRFRYQLGAVAGMTAAAVVLAPFLGLYVTCLIAATLGTGAFLGAWILAYRSSATEATPLSRDDRVTAGPKLRFHAAGETVWNWATFAVVGGLVAIVMRMLNQFAATSGWLVYAQWGAVLAGVALGIRAGLRRSLSRPDRDESVAVAYRLAVAAVCVLLVFGVLIDVSLWINTWLTMPWLVVASRCLIVVALLLPVGLGWGRLSVARTSRQTAAALPRLHVFAVVAGSLSVCWVALRLASTVDVFAILTLALAMLAAVRWSVSRLSRTGAQPPDDERAPSAGLWRRRIRRVAFAASVAALSALPWYRSLYSPLRSARQLFATNVFVARMRGLDRRLLSFLDEGRPVAVVEGDRGTLTLWRYRGTQLQIRENGVPKSLVSTDPRLCPQYSAEVMPAVLPLVLHEKPHHVLLLGANGGVALTTTLSFPVKSVTCVEGDARLQELLKAHVWSESREDPADDGRLRWVTMEPALAVACGGDSYDVIVSTPDQSALLQSSPYFTRGFYRRVSRRLAADGIFCQRFRHVDYGPKPMRIVAKTLQAVFRHVGAVEIAAGEIALLATNSESALSRKGVVKRFQAPHVRNVLSRMGWDWSYPLNLSAFGHEGLKMFADATPTDVNTAANGSFA